MNFSDALILIKSNKKVTRSGWNGVGMYLQLQVPDEHSFMTKPYIYMVLTITKCSDVVNRVPWLASQTDLLSNDWIEVV